LKPPSQVPKQKKIKGKLKSAHIYQATILSRE
jgi:hypothetical protein